MKLDIMTPKAKYQDIPYRSTRGRGPGRTPEAIEVSSLIPL